MGLATEHLESEAGTIDRLTRLWPPPRSFLAWLATVDHKKLGLRYITTPILDTGAGVPTVESLALGIFY